MLYKVITDDNGYVLEIKHTGTVEDTCLINVKDIYIEYLSCYKLEGNRIVLDEAKYSAIKQKEKEAEEGPTEQEKLEAQVLYTALMTDTMLESEAN